MDFQLDPKYNGLTRMNKWDKNTQLEIKNRIQKEIGGQSRFVFLNNEEGQLLSALVDVLIPQDRNEHYIKIAEALDNALSGKKTGVRYGNNPWRGEFYRQGLKALTAQLAKGAVSQEFIQSILEGADGFLKNFLRQVLSDSAAVFYSHPGAWNKIGFPGPAFPIGYFLLDCKDKEKWEPNYFKKNE